ncbi:Mut7-C RNAse domain-containing protein [Candidatus Micrarchaeota archaeon]|nr:Mut7-C RNAse domain-containing protein [Candidatus Micrarchaeota archaeon]
MKFVCDAMLKRLCIWLRMAGHRTFYADVEDDEVIKTALRLNAVLLTRDRKLCQRAGNYCVCYLLHSHSYKEQLREVAGAFKLRFSFSTRFCTVCGGELKKIDKKKVKTEVWPYTYKTHEYFYKCTSCGKVFWRGSHWKRIKTTLSSINKITNAWRSCKLV